MNRILYSSLLASLVLTAACSDDPVSYSAPVGINLKTKSGDVSNTSISEEKGITTESGNPYGAFVTDATQKLGRAPGGIEVDGVTLVLGAGSTNVVNLNEVFTGDVDVAFIINDTNNTYDVGHINSPAGVGPLAIDVNFDAASIAAQDNAKFLGGSFKVVIRGPSAVGFETKGAEAELQLNFTFAAYE
ncbi:MAG: hypothetical protein H0T79_10190 [Deltaproteobacteria bacterium]|nr:hypothetical protein [Deltaproteobacteria bacterium]